MLLAPEKGLLLNETGAAILRLCTGENTIAAILDRLGERFEGRPREEIERDVLRFLAEMIDRSLMTLRDEKNPAGKR
jgi:coenzyme PQQ biosynthesis protein PqqD